MLEGEENKDLTGNIWYFKYKLIDHRMKFRMKPFLTQDTQGTERSARTEGSEDADTGSGGSGAADHAVLKAHGYKVEPDVIVDAKGIAWEPLFKVQPVFSTYYLSRCHSLSRC